LAHIWVERALPAATGAKLAGTPAAGQFSATQRAGLCLLAGLLMVLAVVLSASRTGLLGVLMLALWGVLDRGLPGRVRLALLLAPVAYGLCWLGVAAWAHQAQQTFGAEARLAENDLQSSRVAIWLNAWTLIAQQPWTGVGFGNFNFAWTLTPFPARPVAFFDHSHNLVLELWAELGVPLGNLVLAALLGATWLAWRRSGRHAGARRSAARAAWMLVLMAGAHSLLEYPLWYAYFLLPTAWALGFALRPAAGDALPAPRLGAEETAENACEPGAIAPPSPSPAAGLEAGHAAGSPSEQASAWGLGVAGALLLCGASLATGDYLRVVVIYQPGGLTVPLAERIEHGHRSVLFGHHADYAAVTTQQPAPLLDAALPTTTHVLLDTRLMMAWADVLAERGEQAKARHLAARLREFRNPATKDYFSACPDGPLAAEPPPGTPYQCLPETGALNWRDFTAPLPARPLGSTGAAGAASGASAGAQEASN
jgi:hypothetical protein